MTNLWSTEFPTKPGNYWFYGQPTFGNMNCCYYDDGDKNCVKPRLEMHLIQVRRCVNGLLGICEGQFMNNTKFDKENQRAGYVGKFMPATLPDPPNNM